MLPPSAILMPVLDIDTSQWFALFQRRIVEVVDLASMTPWVTRNSAMAATSVHTAGETSVRRIFENMDYGPAPDADNVAKVSVTYFAFVFYGFCLLRC